MGRAILPVPRGPPRLSSGTRPPPQAACSQDWLMSHKFPAHGTYAEITSRLVIRVHPRSLAISGYKTPPRTCRLPIELKCANQLTKDTWRSTSTTGRAMGRHFGPTDQFPQGATQVLTVNERKRDWSPILIAANERGCTQMADLRTSENYVALAKIGCPTKPATSSAI